MEKILVVDDRAKMLKMIGGFLGKEGFIVYLSDSVEKALGLCDGIKFDLVVSDFDLGKGSGIELINRIKERHPQIKTILMSGSFRFEEEMLEVERIDAFLQKPFDTNELQNSIERILN